MKERRCVQVGTVKIGGGERIKIQSMTTTKTSDLESTLSQIQALAAVDCDIVRVAICDEADALALKTLAEKSPLPIVADIHFSHRLATLAVENGAHKIRINPGNIGGEREVSYVADCVKAHHIPVRVGSNTGSIEKSFLEKYGKNELSLVESALENARILEKCGVDKIVLSVKASSVPLTVKAYTLLAKKTEYPLHLGVTEAGANELGIVKSALGIGSLLLNGIGDTIRVSLTDEPRKEVETAKWILRSCGLDNEFVEVVSCPTCGRCAWESGALAKKVSELVKPYKKRAKIAVMGCVVNGPGEAKDAELGIAGGNGSCLIFKHGEPLKKVAQEHAEEEFIKEIRKLLDGE